MFNRNETDVHAKHFEMKEYNKRVQMTEVSICGPATRWGMKEKLMTQ